MNAKLIEKALIGAKEVSIDEAINAACKAFKQKKSLLWRGSKNKDVLQDITNLFMQEINGYLTEGSLSFGSGEEGIISGRGIHIPLPIEQISDSDTVVIWGSNVTQTYREVLPYLEGKQIVVIDPVKTDIAKKADYYLQIQPRTDFYIAVLLSRFLYMNNEQDEAWLDEFATEHEDFYEFTFEYRIKPILEYCGVNLAMMGHVLSYLQNKKVVFLVGSGVQKYSTGSYVLRAIDSLAAILGLFGKAGCGVHFISSSKIGVKSLFDVDCKKVSKVTTNFSEFNTVLVEQSNPKKSMPNSKKVSQDLDKVENLIYFGLYKNETSAKADIVIPSNKISKYDFTKRLFDAFNFEGLQSEEYYIDSLKKQDKDKKLIPYQRGFGEDDDEFKFIEEYYDDFIQIRQLTTASKSKKNIDDDEQFWLLSIKSGDSSKYDNKIQLHPNLGYLEGEKVKLVSWTGELELEVLLTENVRENCLLVTTNTIGLNILTPSLVSEEGESACFNELKVSIHIPV